MREQDMTQPEDGALPGTAEIRQKRELRRAPEREGVACLGKFISDPRGQTADRQRARRGEVWDDADRRWADVIYRLIPDGALTGKWSTGGFLAHATRLARSQKCHHQVMDVAHSPGRRSNLEDTLAGGCI